MKPGAGTRVGGVGQLEVPEAAGVRLYTARQAPGCPGQQSAWRLTRVAGSWPTAPGRRFEATFRSFPASAHPGGDRELGLG